MSETGREGRSELPGRAETERAVAEADLTLESHLRREEVAEPRLAGEGQPVRLSRCRDARPFPRRVHDRVDERESDVWVELPFALDDEVVVTENLQRDDGILVAAERREVVAPRVVVDADAATDDARAVL